jgi:arginase
LLGALRGAGFRVVNLSDLSLFPLQDDPEHPQARNARLAACAIAATADEVGRALGEGFTLLIGGDCSLLPGMMTGARACLERPVGIVYLDADADLNTPETSPSGRICGMALALALGRGPEALLARPAVDPEHVALLGYRALDPGERAALGDLGLALPADALRRLGARVATKLALDAVDNGGGPYVVHLDVDVIDAGEFPPTRVRTAGRGLTFQETSDLVARLVGSPRCVALEVCEFDPEQDPEGAWASRLVEMIARAVAARR